MRAKALRDMEDGELVKQLTELRKEVFGLRFANATGELDDTASLGRARRDLARALTVAREREVPAQQGRRRESEERTRWPTTRSETAPRRQRRRTPPRAMRRGRCRAR